MADLTWKVSEIKYNCSTLGNNWVRVDPSTGDGSTEVNVYVTAATSPNDCTSATITISASTGDFQKIPVTRCAPECSCQSLGYTGETLNDLPATRGNVLIARYAQGTSCVSNIGFATDGIVLSNPTYSNGNVYADVNENNGSARTGWYRLLYEGEICVEKTVIQKRGVDSCENAACTAISVTFSEGGTSVHDDNNAHNHQFVIAESYKTCWSDPKIKTSETWLTVNGTTINVAANSGSTPTRSGEVVFTFTNKVTGSTCKHKLSIEQDTAPQPTGCSIDGPATIENSCGGGTANYTINKS